jgi:hypothetical protein
MDTLDKLKFNLLTLESSISSEKQKDFFSPIKYPLEMLIKILAMPKDEQKKNISEIKISVERIEKFFGDCAETSFFKGIIPEPINKNRSIVADLSECASQL